MIILYQFDKIWRVIWTDGRELPKDPEPRWFGYSVGKWVDDYTLVVETSGRMKGPGSIAPAVRIAPICAWRSDSIAWITITWS